jgi:hypothetical protein
MTSDLETKEKSIHKFPHTALTGTSPMRLEFEEERSSDLQMGHVRRRRNQVSMQSAWNTWRHGRRRTGKSVLLNSTKQTEHSDPVADEEEES